jgi:hypothetical protein
MKIIKTIFAIFGVVMAVFIFLLVGFFFGFAANSNLKKSIASGSDYDIIDRILVYQRMAEQLDAGNIDSTRYLLTDYQDKVIIGLYPDYKNLKDKRFEGNVSITLNKVAKHRKAFSKFYYPGGKELIPANSNVEILLNKSLKDTIANKLN